MGARSLIKTVLAVLRDRPLVMLSAVLLVGTLSIFWPVRDFEFINYDDYVYVSENPHLQHGVTWEGIRWVVSADLFADSPNADYWIPVTFLSHLFTVQLFGMGPSAHHLVNVVLHAVNTVILFLVLRRMTGALWRSAVVAALFAVHPLHVESVAWVTERKDVLSGLFFMLTLLAYVRYVEQSTLSRYLLVILAFALGLMSKPMLVTVPFLLLLLDYWPLGRFSSTDAQGRPWFYVAWRRIWEKVPLIILSATSMGITYLVQQRVGGVASFRELPFLVRLANSFVSYVSYMGKMVWPVDLAVFYPHPGNTLPVWQVGGAGLVLLLVSALAIRWRRARPYVIIGWLWYLGALVPVIGLVQVGDQAMADRYTYLPFIGLFVIVAWGLPDALSTWRYRTIVLTVTAVGSIAACVVLTRGDLRYWRSTATLFDHALQVTDGNYVAYNNLGLAMAEEERFQEAIQYYRKALLIWPDFPKVRYNIGNALAHEGQNQEAIWHYSQLLQISPDDDKGHHSLGVILGNQGKLDEAIGHFTEALRINPDQAPVHNNLGLALAKQGRFNDAIAYFTDATRLEPKKPDAHYNLGVVYAQLGRVDEAIREFETVLTLNPQFPNARMRLEIISREKRKADRPSP